MSTTDQSENTHSEKTHAELSQAVFTQHWETLELHTQGPILHLWLNRPEVCNAMSELMVSELKQVFQALSTNHDIRAVILRGKNGNFCAGADIKDMGRLRLSAAQGDTAVFARFNRQFGDLMQLVNEAPQIVVAVIEGAVLGGGFGLACVSDVAICHSQAQFGLPETGLGIIPAQIAPFIVQRIGLTQARRLALLGMRFDGTTAQRLGLVHEAIDHPAALESALHDLEQQIRRTAPEASRVTKALLQRVGQQELHSLLDQAAEEFGRAVSGPEGQEGTMAFVQKRLPSWAS